MGGNDEAFHSDLQCCVRTVSYDFRTRCGRLDMEGGDCCDMTACIAFFRAIDPQVSKIETFSGEDETVRGGAWSAMQVSNVLRRR